MMPHCAAGIPLLAPASRPAVVLVDRVSNDARWINPLHEARWDALVTRHPQCTFFHGAAWARVLHGAYGYAPLYFTTRSAGAFDCVLPFMEIRSRLTGVRGVSLPFTDSCEPLILDRPPGPEFLADLAEYGRRRGWRYFECRGGGILWSGAMPSLTFYAHSLDLQQPEAAIWDHLDSSVRRAIRRARKLGVSIEMSQSMDALRAFYALHCRTRRKHGLPAPPFSFFQQLHEHVISDGAGLVVLAKHCGKAVAAAVFVHLGKRALFKFGASDESAQTMRGNNLVMWEAIRWYGSRGFHHFDFGRTSLRDEGLRRFKLGWGVRERTLEYFRFDLEKNSFVSDRERAFGWHNHLFRRMPLPMSRLCGAFLYRHMA